MSITEIQTCKNDTKPHFDYDSAANLLHPAASPLSTLKKEPASDCTLKVML